MSTSTLERPDIVVEEVEEKGPDCNALGDHLCTKTAVAVGRPTCGPFPIQRVCQSIVDLYKMGVQMGGLCGDCGRPVADCWELEPL